MSWIERGGPAVAEPQRKGFGSRLIARGLGNAGRAHPRFLEAGYELDLEVPAADLLSS